MSASSAKQIQPLSNSISKVFAIVVLRNDGSRIYSKYYNNCFPESINITKEGNLADINVQKTFEKSIFEKSRKLVNIKAMKPSDNVQIYIIADPDENEALLGAALKCIVDSMSTFSKEQLNIQIVIENFQGLILIIDEVIDQGILVNIDSGVVISRYSMLDCDDVSNQLPAASGSGNSSSSTSTSEKASQQNSGSSISSQASSTVGFLKSLFNR